MWFKMAKTIVKMEKDKVVKVILPLKLKNAGVQVVDGENKNGKR